MKKVAILGSTGHVGRKALEVIKTFSEELKVHSLCCGTNVELLKQQIKEFSPKFISVSDQIKAKNLKKTFNNIVSIEELVTDADVDLVLFAMDGSNAVIPAFLAVEAGKDIALANKEILACAGEALSSKCREKNVTIYPIDNEHSAIDQCLRGENIHELDKLLLTASGGPFFQYNDKTTFSLQKAISHPTYSCGKKVAINCSTMMNKGLEIIEAKHLFNISADKIDVVIHPQSIVQSLISFKDGAIKAVLGNPDISHPLQYALLQKVRKKGKVIPFNFNTISNFSFYPKDLNKFRCLKLAFEALKAGGAKSAYLNAANEVLVERFCQGEVSWKGIGEILEELMNKKPISSNASLESVLMTDEQARVDAWTISER